jgi:hypothetical protein
MESEDRIILQWAIEDTIKNWHAERPGDRPKDYNQDVLEREIRQLVSYICD